MGHERVGSLPRSIRWRRIVEQIHGSPQSDTIIASISGETLENVRTRLDRIQTDPGVKAAFRFLVALPICAASPQMAGDASLSIDFKDNPSALRITTFLRQWVETRQGSLEYAEIAQRAAADAIVKWTRRQKVQGDILLGEPSAAEVWGKAASGAGFCEVARLFFANFTERYLNYFLEREASSVLPNIEERERFALGIRNHVNNISKHAFETARITQSFAAGWYNKHARDRLPSEREIEGFLSIAFGKIREELLREQIH